MKEETWIKQYWRPAIAWQYFAVCLCDFIIFPLIAFRYGVTWNPLTLRESGFYHMSMAAIIGVSAYTRGQEKIEKMIIENKSSTTEEGK
jgi:hypothetical protein